MHVVTFMLLCALLLAVTLNSCAFPSAVNLSVLYDSRQQVFVQLYSFNCWFFVMQMLCVFCGVPTDLMRNLNIKLF